MTRRTGPESPKSHQFKKLVPWVNENGLVPGHTFRAPVPYVQSPEMRRALARAAGIKALPSRLK